MIRKVISPAVLLCVAAAASAGPWPPELKACAAQKDATARLACYDRAAAAAEVGTAVTTPEPPASTASRTLPPATGHPGSAPPPAVPSSPKDPQADPDYGLDGAALRHKQRERGEIPAVAPKPQPLVAHVVDVTRIGQAEVTVRLDNGQVWKQTDGAGNLSIAPRDTVTITAGSLGAYFLTCADRRVVHVKRIQ